MSLHDLTGELSELNEHLAHCSAWLAGGVVQTSSSGALRFALEEETHTINSAIDMLTKLSANQQQIVAKINEIVAYLAQADTLKLKVGGVPGRLT